jgi:hypothetical protein
MSTSRSSRPETLCMCCKNLFSKSEVVGEGGRFCVHENWNAQSKTGRGRRRGGQTDLTSTSTSGFRPPVVQSYLAYLVSRLLLEGYSSLQRTGRLLCILGCSRRICSCLRFFPPPRAAGGLRPEAVRSLYWVAGFMCIKNIRISKWEMANRALNRGSFDPFRVNIFSLKHLEFCPR